MAGETIGRHPLPERGREGFTKNRQSDRAGASHTRYPAPGNDCGRGPKSKGKAETASRDKNVSGAADSGESRRGGTRAVSFADPCHFEFRRTVDRPQLPLVGGSPREARVSAAGARRKPSAAHQEGDSAPRGRGSRESARSKREDASSGKDLAGARLQRKVRWECIMTEYHT